MYRALAHVGHRTNCYLDSMLLSHFQEVQTRSPHPRGFPLPWNKIQTRAHMLCSQHCCASAGNASLELPASFRGTVPEPVWETPPLRGPVVATPYREIRRVGVHVCVCRRHTPWEQGPESVLSTALSQN